MSEGIVPDTKNWTWVLERRCDDCGFDASRFDARHTGTAIRDLSARWQVVLAQADTRVRPRSDVWSPLEYGCHLRDVFRLFEERLELMLSEEEPSFANWDQDATAIEDAYGDQDARVVTVQLADAAARLADRFDGVTSDQWQRRGLRSDGSVFTVDTLGRYLMHDPVHHLWDVSAEVPSYL